MKRLAIWGLCLVFGILYAASKAPQSPQDPAHYHIDLKIYIKGQPVDLSLPKYQTDSKENTRPIHLHDNDGNVIHFHLTGLTLQDFFSSLKGDLTPNCLYWEGQKYCTGFTNSLKVFVNGKRQLLPHRYEPKDLDQILVTFGPHWDRSLKDQQDSLTSDACIYSLSCPEKGAPPAETCSSDSTSPCVLPGSPKNHSSGEW